MCNNVHLCHVCLSPLWFYLWWQPLEQELITVQIYLPTSIIFKHVQLTLMWLYIQGILLKYMALNDKDCHTGIHCIHWMCKYLVLCWSPDFLSWSVPFASHILSCIYGLMVWLYTCFCIILCTYKSQMWLSIYYVSLFLV